MYSSSVFGTDILPAFNSSIFSFTKSNTSCGTKLEVVSAIPIPFCSKPYVVDVPPWNLPSTSSFTVSYIPTSTLFIAEVNIFCGAKSLWSLSTPIPYLLASFIASILPVPTSPAAVNTTSAPLDIIWLVIALPFA